MQQSTIRNILEVKGYHIWAVEPQASVYAALRVMSDKDVGALLVLDGDEMVGIISERDYARKVILVGKTSRETRVEEIMSQKVITIRPNQTVDEAMELMNSKHIRHLPVMDGKRLIGIITIGDLVRVIIFEQLEAMKQLEDRLIAQWQH